MSRKQILFAVLTVATFSTWPLYAANWHYGVSLVCSDCHTQHNSANGEPMRTDKNPTPAAMLLRRGTPLELCLSCHDGSDPNAPDVIAPVSYVAESAAGAFPNGGGVPTNTAHHLANPSAEVPPGGTQAMVLVCTTCHDPHGNENYRNLRPDPSNTNQSPAIISVVQTNVPNGVNPAQVYTPQNVLYKSGVSRWCGTCHGASTPGHHPTGVDIWTAKFAKYAAWAATKLPRVPVSNPADAVIPSTDDTVECISCHKAHGSNNPNAQIWADSATLTSTCQECHDK